MKTKLCGIDSSTTNTGISLYINGEYSDCVLIGHKDIKELGVRTSAMIKSILEQLNKWNPDIIVIEDDWNKNNVQTTKALSEIIGAVHGYCIAKDLDFVKMLPSKWRSLIGFEIGNKKRPELKQMAIEYINDKYNLSVNDDVAESCCIAEALVNYYQQL